MQIRTLPLKSFSAIAFSLLVASIASSSAQSSQKQVPGKVVAANVVQNVKAMPPQSASELKLKTKDVISEDYTVSADTDSTATLVFSNGATFNVLEESSIVISEFLQDPFSTPFAMPTATEEPTTSTTELNLNGGEVVSKVKKLNISDGSSMTIRTPVGAAGVRGTTFALSYLPNQNGTDRGTLTLSVTEGEVSFTDKDGNVTIVRAGQELTISFKSSVDPATGITTVTEIVSTSVGPIPAARLARINQAVDAGETSAEFVIFEGADGNLLNTLQVLTAPGGAPVIPIPADLVTDPNP